MLDKRFIRDNPDEVEKAVREKGIDLDVDELLKLDRASRELQHKVDETQALRRSSAGASAAMAPIAARLISPSGTATRRK